jgi:hypothetical protein
VCVNLEVLWTPPGRREKDDVGRIEVGHDVEKVSHDELYPVLDAVNAGVVSREADLLGVNVDGDDALAGKGELMVCERRVNIYESEFRFLTC